MPRPREQTAPPLSTAFRAAFADLRADYALNTNSRFRPQPRGVLALGSGADYHYRTEAWYMRGIERSRAYDRDNMVVGQGVNRLVANIVQEGFTLDVDTGDRDLDTELTARWGDWAEDPEQVDSEGEKTFADLERLLLRHTVVDGDCCLLPMRDGTLQHIEGHRLRTPQGTKRNVVLGILLSDTGRRDEYWFTKTDVNPLAPVAKVSEIQPYKVRDSEGRRQVYHVYNPARLSQRRGVSAFAPTVDCIGMHDDLQFAHLVKAQVASCFAIFEELDVKVRRPGETVTGKQSLETLDDGSTRTQEGLSPGMRVRGAPGVTLKGFSPNIPNPEFFPHANLILTFIAINLDLPVAVLLLDPSQTNFSGWRGAIDQARLRFRQIQRWYARVFHTPVYLHKLRQWMADDPALARQLTRSDVSVLRHCWHPQGFAYIEPMRDAQADDFRAARGLTSRRRIQAERGRDEEDVSLEIMADNGALIRLAKKEAAAINTEYPDDAPVSWQHVLQPFGALPNTAWLPELLSGDNAADAQPPPKK